MTQSETTFPRTLVCACLCCRRQNQSLFDLEASPTISKTNCNAFHAASFSCTTASVPGGQRLRLAEMDSQEEHPQPWMILVTKNYGMERLPPLHQNDSNLRILELSNQCC